MTRFNKKEVRLYHRVFSASIALPILFLFVLVGSPWLTILVLFVTVLAVFEYYRLFRGTLVRKSLVPGLILALAFILNSYLISIDLLNEKSLLILAIVGLSAALILFCLFNRTFPFSREALFSIVGPSYLGFAMAHILLLRRLDEGTQWLAWTLLIVFGTDTAAFFIGRKFGKYRIAPNISPNKTWEGAIAGFIGGVFVAIGTNFFIGLPISILQIFLLGAGASLLAQGGDLAESAMKRYVGVKDAGALIPGHGGRLDRLDSVLPVMNLVYYALYLVVV